MAKKTATKKTTTKSAKTTKTAKSSGVARKAAPRAGSKAALRAGLLQVLPVDDGSGRRKAAGTKTLSPEAAITALLELAFDIAEEHDIEITID